MHACFNYAVPAGYYYYLAAPTRVQTARDPKSDRSVHATYIYNCQLANPGQTARRRRRAAVAFETKSGMSQASNKPNNANLCVHSAAGQMGARTSVCHASGCSGTWP